MEIHPMPEAAVSRGLQDVIAGESEICFIDGKEGRLIYRGYDIRDLAERSRFEEVAYLLWYGQLPTSNQLQDLQARIRQLRVLPEGVREVLARLPSETTPMDALRTAVSALASFEPNETQAGATSIGGALRLTAVLPTIMSEFDRRRRGLGPLPPRSDLSHAANVLY
ncbi:MAG: citrate/2-methylcitrate synthase, partial [Thermoplasmata archaeon]